MKLKAQPPSTETQLSAPKDDAEEGRNKVFTSEAAVQLVCTALPGAPVPVVHDPIDDHPVEDLRILVPSRDQRKVKKRWELEV